MSIDRTFNKRLRNIHKTHRKLACGSVSVVSKSGLIVSRPRRNASRFPMKGIIFCLLGMFAFKGLVHADIGDISYQGRIDRLAEGTIVEQAGAYAMSMDPVSQWFSSQFHGMI